MNDVPAQVPTAAAMEKPRHPLNLEEDATALEAEYDPYDPSGPDAPDPHVPSPDGAHRAFDPIDWPYLESLRHAFLDDIVSKYFRAELIGAEKLPKEGPIIVAANHSGNAFPHDAMILDALLWRHQGFTKEAKFRTVFTPKLAAAWWMRPYGLDNWWRRAGGVDMTFVNFDRLLEARKKVIYFPEGVPGIGKGFLRRYQLQKFHSSFAVLAAKHHAPVYPVSIVNAEWVNPTSITFPALDRLVSRLTGLPFFPIPIVFFALLFPFVFYLAFPSRMVFRIGDPIDVREMLKRMGEDPEHPAREAFPLVAEEIRRRAQRDLDEAVARYGKKPYDWKGFIRAMRSIRGHILRATPLGWPYTYLRHERDRRRPPARNRIHAFLRDLDIAAFYLPLGWLPIALMRRLRKPPYGYRGLSKEERREREGSYLWTLDSRPLPDPPTPLKP